MIKTKNNEKFTLSCIYQKKAVPLWAKLVDYTMLILK